jgi:hypothetical protein
MGLLFATNPDSTSSSVFGLQVAGAHCAYRPTHPQPAGAPTHDLCLAWPTLAWPVAWPVAWPGSLPGLVHFDWLDDGWISLINDWSTWPGQAGPRPPPAVRPFYSNFDWLEGLASWPATNLIPYLA